MSSFRPATKKKSRLRATFDGVAGSGKTFTAMRGAAYFARQMGGPWAIISSESGATEKYLGLSPDGIQFDFQICQLDDYSPTSYTAKILEAAQHGFVALVIDSLSHAWDGVGGALEQVDRRKGSSGNSFTAWKDVTPMHRRMVEAILRSPCHIFATMRSKQEYILEEQESRGNPGKVVLAPRRVGMAPVQRSGMEYEFDIVADLDIHHVLTVSKTRCPAIDGAVIVKPGADFFRPIYDWLNEGVEPPANYYIASAADLAAHEARIAEQEKATARAERAAAPRKTLAELQAEQEAAMQAAKQAASPPAEKPKIGEPMRNTQMDEWAANYRAELAKELGPANPDDPGSISARLESRIRDWLACLPITPAQAQAAVQKRGANRLRELSHANALGLLDNLIAMGLKYGHCPQPKSDTNGNSPPEPEHRVPPPPSDEIAF